MIRTCHIVRVDTAHHLPDFAQDRGGLREGIVPFQASTVPAQSHPHETAHSGSTRSLVGSSAETNPLERGYGTPQPAPFQGIDPDNFRYTAVQCSKPRGFRHGAAEDESNWHIATMPVRPKH